MKEENLPIRIREAVGEDISFIFNSWLKSYRKSHFSKPIDNTIYFDSHHKVIERLIKENKVLIACDPKHPDQIFGYICAGHIEGFLMIHYIYVKHNFRNMGIGKTLLNSFEHNPSSTGIYSHHTMAADKLAPRYNLVFHPYFLFKLEESNKKD